NGRLHAELSARLEELRDSRSRVIAAGQEERERLERNLHDGAQQRLIALSLELGLLGERLGDNPEAGSRLERARREVRRTLEALGGRLRVWSPRGGGTRVRAEMPCA